MTDQQKWRLRWSFGLTLNTWLATYLLMKEGDMFAGFCAALAVVVAVACVFALVFDE